MPGSIKRLAFKNRLSRLRQSGENAIFAMTMTTFNPNNMLDIYKLNESRTDFSRRTITERQINQFDYHALPVALPPPVSLPAQSSSSSDSIGSISVILAEEPDNESFNRLARSYKAVYNSFYRNPLP